MSSEPNRFLRGLGLEELVRQMPDIMLIVDPAGKVLLQNDKAREMTERLGARVGGDLSAETEVFHPDGRRYPMAEWPIMRSVAQGEHVVDEEYFHLDAAGNRILMQCTSSPVYGDDGRIVAAVAVARDITAAKQAQERLAYHAHLLENLLDAVVAADDGLVVTAWNRGAEDLYGWRADEALGRDLREVIGRDRTEEQWSKAVSDLASRGRRHVEAQMQRKDGSAVWVEALTIALRDAAGGITGYVSMNRDVSERKRFESEQRQLADIVEHSSDFIGIAGLDWRPIFVNEAGQDLVGLSGPEEVRRTTVLDYFFPEDRPHVRDEILPAILANGRWKGELDFRHFRTGQRIPVLWDAFRLDDADTGEAKWVATVTRNITDRKEAEEALERRARQQAAVARFGLRALARQDLRPLMDEAVALVAETLDADYAKLSELLPAGADLLVRAWWGRADALDGTTERAGAGSQAGLTVLLGQPVVAEDLAEERRFEVSAAVSAQGARSAASVVVPRGGGAFGALETGSCQHRRFSDDEVNFLQAVANVVATAVERAEADRSLRDVRERERSRIARDLHDEALRDLAEAVAQTQGAQTFSHDEAAGAHLDGVVSALQRVGQQVRAVIYDLRGAEVDRPFPEMVEALVRLHRGTSGDHHIELDMRQGVPPGLLGRTGTELLRIVGEALTNACRHSQARNIRVGLWGSEHTLWAEVADDGVGFDPPREAMAEGFGIRGMRERAATTGAELDIRTAPGAGTNVRVGMPLPGSPHQAEEDLRILLVEDHAAVREALAAAFAAQKGFEVAGQAATLAQARQMLNDVDVAVVDLALPDGHGGQLIRELREVNPEAQALVLSASVDRADIARAVDSGAAAVLSKTAHLEEVVTSVRRLRSGQALMPPSEVVELLRFASRQREEEEQERQLVSRLTPREREVLQALAEGLDSYGIARRLHITVRTERNHMANILAKLGVHSRLQVLVFALRHSVVVIR